jgi:hypothetical protein
MPLRVKVSPSSFLPSQPIHTSNPFMLAAMAIPFVKKAQWGGLMPLRVKLGLIVCHYGYNYGVILCLIVSRVLACEQPPVVLVILTSLQKPGVIAYYRYVPVPSIRYNIIIAKSES